MPHMDSVNLICLFKQVIKIMIFLKLDILGLLKNPGFESRGRLTLFLNFLDENG